MIVEDDDLKTLQCTCSDGSCTVKSWWLCFLKTLLHAQWGWLETLIGTVQLPRNIRGAQAIGAGFVTEAMWAVLAVLTGATYASKSEVLGAALAGKGSISKSSRSKNEISTELSLVLLGWCVGVITISGPLLKYIW
jgi:hypothetical protein